MAEYDNATRYNDHVLGMVFDAMRNTQAVVVYLPDHGEEIYDWRDQYGRSTTPEYTSAYMHSMNDIPLIVWASPLVLIARNPQVWHRLQGAVARPGMSDGLSSSALWRRQPSHSLLYSTQGYGQRHVETRAQNCLWKGGV